MPPKSRTSDAAAPKRVRIKKTVRVSTASGIITFEQHKVYTDPTLIALIIKNGVPHRNAESEDD